MLFSVYDSDLLTSVASLSVYSLLYEDSSVELHCIYMHYNRVSLCEAVHPTGSCTGV